MDTITGLATLSGLGLSLIGLGLYRWYFQQVATARSQIQHASGQPIPGQRPRFLLGNLLEVYGSPNQLAAYHRFHERWGQIVQIFWLWRQQISVCEYRAARQILVTRQHRYRKYPPNRLIQKLYGNSVLTQEGTTWYRQRLLIKPIFSPGHLCGFHDLFVESGQRLAERWQDQIPSGERALCHDIYPDLVTASLDVIAKAALGTDLGASRGRVDQVLESIALILKRSTQPVYQFVSWWHHLPLASNRQLQRSFQIIDDFLYGLIQSRRETYRQGESGDGSPKPPDLLDLLLQATVEDEQGNLKLSDREVRDNLLAIVINGHETVAVSMALTLSLLASHPPIQHQVRQEIDGVMGSTGLTSAGVSQLPLLRATILESLRLYPPMAGLQRVSQAPDTVLGWSIPTEQVVGIPLMPLHRTSEIYGEAPEQFRPERYLERSGGCPFHAQARSQSLSPSRSTPLPLSFGDGARRCLGEAFAMQEMTILVAILLHRFELQPTSAEPIETELGKFGLFISMLPKRGVTLKLRPR